MLSDGDRLAIRDLLDRYGFLIDERRWGDLGLVLADDVVYDATEFGLPVTRSLAELVAEWTSPEGLRRHPIAHHATNVVVDDVPPGADEVAVWSKGIGVGPGGRVGSVTYTDRLVRTPAGWRIAERTVRLRRPPDGGEGRWRSPGRRPLQLGDQPDVPVRARPHGEDAQHGGGRGDDHGEAVDPVRGLELGEALGPELVLGRADLTADHHQREGADGREPPGVEPG